MSVYPCFFCCSTLVWMLQYTDDDDHADEVIPIFPADNGDKVSQNYRLEHTKFRSNQPRMIETEISFYQWQTTSSTVCFL